MARVPNSNDFYMTLVNEARDTKRQAQALLQSHPDDQDLRKGSALIDTMFNIVTSLADNAINRGIDVNSQEGRMVHVELCNNNFLIQLVIAQMRELLDLDADADSDAEEGGEND
jgi:hypothetical protein